MDTNDKAAQAIDFNRAKVTSTYKNISRQIVDSNDAVTRTTRRLQTSLDIAVLIEIFTQELSGLMKPGLVRFQTPSGNSYSFGEDSGAHNCQFNLAIEDTKLGKLTVNRRKRYSEEEISIVEFMASLLVFPLRNALLYQEALANALTDELTGMGNKRALQSSLHREAERAIRHKIPLSAIIMDIDHFKMINDQFGHACGDAVLSQLAEVIKANFRKSDLCFRYGGEEFILLLDDADIGQAKHSAERLRQAIENELFVYNGEAHAITASFGCACFDASETLENFIVRADKALYSAKRNGRNQVITHPPTNNLQPCADAIEK
jgi:diguanylate cyclase (GGDEF)-like protein